MFSDVGPGLLDDLCVDMEFTSIANRFAIFLTCSDHSLNRCLDYDARSLSGFPTHVKYFSQITTIMRY